jgi:hypothetical protein
VPELVDITPHVSLLAKVGQSGHSVSDAVAELVDNAIDARRAGTPVQVDVEVDVTSRMLVVCDDGRGMTGAELGRALVLAESNKNGDDIGRFGLGLKTACTSLGRRFVIESATAGGHYAHVAEYDADAFLANGRWVLPISRRRKQWKQGTIIRIESDRLYPALLAGLNRNLGWSFRHFLLDDVLRLMVNGNPVAPGEYDVDPESVLPIEGRVAGRSVRGWVGLLRQSSQRGWYGFALIRHRRVVRRHEKLGFRAHPQTARVVGELHLDEFDTNNLKTDYIRETEVWRELEEWVGQASEPIVAASRALAHAGMLDLQVRTRIADRRSQVESEGLNLPNGLLPQEPGRSRAVSVAIGPLHLEHVYVEGAAQGPYATVEDVAREAEVDLIVVHTNVGHPAASQVSDRSGWACHNIAEAAATRMTRGTARSEDLLELKGVILSKLLAERSLRRALTQAARDMAREPAEAVLSA